jgi:hypothetical protein
MDRVDPVPPADMVDRVYFRRIGIEPVVAVRDNSAVLPASFKEFIDDLHIFVREVVAVVVLDLPIEPHRPRGAVEIAGHDVPADTPPGEVIERR